MRWKGLIFLLVLVILFFISSLIFTNPWLEKQIEEAGTFVVGAKVDLDGLDFSFTDLRIKWQRLQITDPGNTMKNIIETGDTEFDMELIPLLSGKVIIENIKLTGLQSGTPRETDGRIDRKKTAAGESFIGQTIMQLEKEAVTGVGDQFMALKKNVNIDSIIKLLNIESIDKIKALQTDLTAKYGHWDTKLSGIDITKDSREIEQKIKSLDVNKAKTLEGFQKTLSDIEDIRNKISDMEKQISQTEKELQTDLSTASAGLTSIDDWIAADYQRAMAMAKLPEINAKNIGKLVFGNRIVNQITQYLSYIDLARSYSDRFSTEDPEKKSPPRLKGQTIYFPGKKAEPDFWIQEILLSGKSGTGLMLSGDAHNLVSDQRMIGKPTEFKISGSKETKPSLNISGSFNYLDKEPGEKFNITYSGYSLSGTKLSSSKFLPNEVKSGTGTLSTDLKLSGNTIDGVIRFRASQLVFASADNAAGKNKFEEIIQSIVSDISTIDLTAKLNVRDENIKLSIDTNLDELFIDRIKNLAGREIEAAKAKIKSEIDSRITEYRSDLNTYVASNEQKLIQEIEKYQMMVDENTKMLDAKKQEAEKLFEKEKSNIKDKVNNLFKF